MATACASSPLDLDGTVLYRPRRPHETILFQTILEHLETWMATLREADPDDDPIPGYVEEAFRRYITCRDPAHGFGRARCGRCGLDFMVAFSCRGRGLCPACSARYMVETAAHLVDDVEDLFQAGDITQDTVLVLANAIYFKADWEYEFPKSETYDGSFTLADGGQISTPLMRASDEHLPYYEDEDVQVIELPYKGEELGMVVILPRRSMVQTGASSVF